jgi:uncharacterized protein involved in exopolysaccharide biosynthesis
MESGQLSPAEIISFVKRRKWELGIVPGVAIIVCVIAAFALPRRYESSTTIWAQPDEILNPLVNYEMAVQLASGDRLSTLSEIVNSRQTIEAVIDSVGLADHITTEVDKDILIQAVRSNIYTGRRSSNTFSITYADTDPVRAQKIVSLLAEQFISTRIQGEQRRNELTVRFFERKVNEYQVKYEKTQREMVAILTQRLRKRPSGSEVVTARLEGMDKEISTKDRRLKGLEASLVLLKKFPQALGTEEGEQALITLVASDIPYLEELRTIAAQYTDVTGRYTPRHPEVQAVQNKMNAVLERATTTVQAEITSLTSQLADIRTSRDTAIEDLMRISIEQQVTTDQQSDYNLFKRLYEDMKTKLEQARITRELGRGAENSFIIIDPPRVPTMPTKPNRKLIIAGGGVFGILLGLLVAFAMEAIDTRIRSKSDLARYRRPVIALLPPVHIHRS